LGSKEEHLDTMTSIENYERKFIRSKTVQDVDDQLRHQLLLAFQDYLRTIPAHKKEASQSYQVNNNSFFFYKNYNFFFLFYLGQRYCSSCITWYRISRKNII
jgi:hypothetical protein